MNGNLPSDPSLISPSPPLTTQWTTLLLQTTRTRFFRSSSHFVSLTSLTFARFGALFIGTILGAVWVVSLDSLLPALISMSFVQAIRR